MNLLTRIPLRLRRELGYLLLVMAAGIVMGAIVYLGI